MQKYSRRDLGLLLPVLASATASAQKKTQITETTVADTSLEKLPRLGTKAYAGSGGNNGADHLRRAVTIRPRRCRLHQLERIHNAKNVGSVCAQYFIVNIGRDHV